MFNQCCASGSCCHFDADPDPARHFDADPNPSFQIKAQNLEVREAHVPYILARHLEIDAVPDPDSANQFYTDTDPANHFDADPDPGTATLI
jgi:hypothetical protein